MKVRVAVSIAAAIVLGGHLLWPNVRLDGASIALIGLIAAPWLTVLFKSIEIPGLGKFESQLQDLKAATDSASEKAESALIASGGGHALSEGETLLGLGDEYDGLRAAHESSPARTQLLTQIAGRMLALGATLDSHALVGALAGASPGRRLAAYISLYRYPEPPLAETLVDTLVRREDTAFGQYWGIQAVRQVVAAAGSGVLTDRSKAEIAALYAHIEPGTSRHHELRALSYQLKDSGVDPASESAPSRKPSNVR